MSHIHYLRRHLIINKEIEVKSLDLRNLSWNWDFDLMSKSFDFPFCLLNASSGLFVFDGPPKSSSSINALALSLLLLLSKYKEMMEYFLQNAHHHLNPFRTESCNFSSGLDSAFSFWTKWSIERRDRLVRRLYGIELISQQYSNTANSWVEVKPTSSKDFILLDLPKMLSYKVPFGIQYLDEAWVNRMRCVITENIASCSCSCDQDGILDDFDPFVLWLGDAILVLRGDWDVVGCALEFGEGIIEDFFLFWIIWGTDVSLEFLDRVLMVLFAMSFGGVQGRRGSAVDPFLQLLLLFLISTSVEKSKRKKQNLTKKENKHKWCKT